jgi:tetratricopeptide (TPR) repeat protein
MLVVLGGMGVASLLAPTPLTTGLPDDPDVAEARAIVGEARRLELGGLRLSSAMGIVGGGTPADAAMARAIAPRAEVSLERAWRRLPRDPRIEAALGHLELAAGRYEHAERRYRDAIGRAATYGEARLGLGVALAMQARLALDPNVERTRQLAAIAQFAAVPERDPHHAEALHNRIMLLRDVGRDAEADRLAATAS